MGNRAAPPEGVAWTRAAAPPRLYPIAGQPVPIEERRLEAGFPEAGAEIFTFG